MQLIPDVIPLSRYHHVFFHLRLLLVLSWSIAGALCTCFPSSMLSINNYSIALLVLFVLFSYQYHHHACIHVAILLPAYSLLLLVTSKVPITWCLVCTLLPYLMSKQVGIRTWCSYFRLFKHDWEGAPTKQLVSWDKHGVVIRESNRSTEWMYVQLIETNNSASLCFNASSSDKPAIAERAWRVHDAWVTK